MLLFGFWLLQVIAIASISSDEYDSGMVRPRNEETFWPRKHLKRDPDTASDPDADSDTDSNSSPNQLEPQSTSPLGLGPNEQLTTTNGMEDQIVTAVIAVEGVIDTKSIYTIQIFGGEPVPENGTLSVRPDDEKSTSTAEPVEKKTTASEEAEPTEKTTTTSDVAGPADNNTIATVVTEPEKTGSTTGETSEPGEKTTTASATAEPGEPTTTAIETAGPGGTTTAARTETGPNGTTTATSPETGPSEEATATSTEAGPSGAPAATTAETGPGEETEATTPEAAPVSTVSEVFEEKTTVNITGGAAEKSSGGGIPGWAIFLIIIFLIGAVVGVVVIIYFCLRRKKERESFEEKQPKSGPRKSSRDYAPTVAKFWPQPVKATETRAIPKKADKVSPYASVSTAKSTGSSMVEPTQSSSSEKHKSLPSGVSKGNRTTSDVPIEVKVVR